MSVFRWSRVFKVGRSTWLRWFREDGEDWWAFRVSLYHARKERY